MIAEEDGEIVSMALGMQGLDDDGAGPPIPGLLHISMVATTPTRWGESLGQRVIADTLAEARSRGFDRAQLWTHRDNSHARRLYEGQGFVASGREKEDESGALIDHFSRGLSRRMGEGGPALDPVRNRPGS